MSNRLLGAQAEAAERFGVSIRTIERLVGTDRLPQVHVERMARFRVSDLEAYVNCLAEHLLDRHVSSK
jgi:excisionase family DNA binding protein